MDLAYILTGLLVGCIIGLTRVCGGSLMTPILVLVFNIKPADIIVRPILAGMLFMVDVRMAA